MRVAYLRNQKRLVWLKCNGWGFAVQLLRGGQLFAIQWTAAHQASVCFTISLSLLKFMAIESVMLSNHFIFCLCLFSCLPSFPASESFPVSQLFASGGQNCGASPSASVLPVNIQGWFPLRWTGFISMQSKGLSRVFSSTAVWRHQFFGAQAFLWSNSHISIWLLENHSFHYMDLCQQSDISAFNYTKFVIAFFPRSSHILISWL